MTFVIRSSTGESLPQETLRSIVEAADTWRGQAEAFVVFRERPPHEIVSVHPSEKAARTAVGETHGLSYLGPIAPVPKVPSIGPVAKTTGCGFTQLKAEVATVVLLDARGKEVGRFTVYDGKRLPNAASDAEAVFLTASGLDKFMIPWLAKVFGPEYAAAKRREWVR